MSKYGKSPRARAVIARRMRMFGCGVRARVAPVIIRPPPRPYYPPPRPYPRPTPTGGCGPGRKFDSCGCRCVPKDAITPQCIRNCTSCGVGMVFNWCVMRCVPIASRIRQCPPLDGSTVGSYYASPQAPPQVLPSFGELTAADSILNRL